MNSLDLNLKSEHFTRLEISGQEDQRNFSKYQRKRFFRENLTRKIKILKMHSAVKRAKWFCKSRCSHSALFFKSANFKLLLEFPFWWFFCDSGECRSTSNRRTRISVACAARFCPCLRPLHKPSPANCAALIGWSKVLMLFLPIFIFYFTLK